MEKFWDIYHNEMPAFIWEFAQTTAMQRLKDIGMNCGCEYTSFAKFKDTQKYSRFVHSVGVALIIWHFTEDKAQSLAGLFHDIATPTFAHTVDFLNNDHENQESTEDNTREIIANSRQIMALLFMHNINLEAVCDYHQYAIADNKSPQLSADRLEYSLGNMVNYGFTSFTKAKSFYDDLVVTKNEKNEAEIAFQTKELAIEFTKNILKNSRLYISDEDRYAMQKLADILNLALSEEIIRTGDLHTQESELINKLLANEKTRNLWLNYTKLTKIKTSKEKLLDSSIKVSAKRRYIDSLVVGKGRISSLNAEIAGEIEHLRSIDFDYWLSEC